MVLLIQQVFGGWQKHLHEFRHLSNDVNSAQCCLYRKNSSVSTYCNDNAKFSEHLAQWELLPISWYTKACNVHGTFSISLLQVTLNSIRGEFNKTTSSEEGKKEVLIYKVIHPVVRFYIMHFRSDTNCKAALPFIGLLQSVFQLLGRV